METIGLLKIGIIVYAIDNLRLHRFTVGKELPNLMR
jgi:hypothetical protein